MLESVTCNVLRWLWRRPTSWDSLFALDATTKVPADFMAGLLDLSVMERRIAACLVFEEETLRSGVRREALRPLHYLFLTGGELERGEFKSMLGLGERTAVSALSALVKRGLLKSDTPQGKVRFALPLHALRFYFPALWPEAEADAQRR